MLAGQLARILSLLIRVVLICCCICQFSSFFNQNTRGHAATAFPVAAIFEILMVLVCWGNFGGYRGGDANALLILFSFEVKPRAPMYFNRSIPTYTRIYQNREYIQGVFDYMRNCMKSTKYKHNNQTALVRRSPLDPVLSAAGAVLSCGSPKKRIFLSKQQGEIPVSPLMLCQNYLSNSTTIISISLVAYNRLV